MNIFKKTLFISLFIFPSFTMISCTKWKMVNGEYDSHTFVPRGLFVMDSTRLFCGAKQGLFELNSSGNFIHLDLPVKENVVLRCLAKNDSFLFAGFEGGGLFRSIDKNYNWESMGKESLTNNRLWGMLAHDSMLIAVTWPRFIHRSLDNGKTWSNYSEGMPEGGMGVCFGHSNGIIALDTFMFISLFNEGVFRRGLNENKWIPARTGLPEGFKTRSICKLDSILFCSTEDGVYRSEDYGLSWKPSNKGIEKLMSISLLAANNYLYTTTNKGLIYQSFDKGYTWTSTSKGLKTGFVIYDIKKINNHLYITVDDQKKQKSGVFRKKVKKSP